MAASRVTQADIARRAGVHRTTVSLALKNDPRILAETKEHVRRIADELGYVPDPMLSSLVAYRTQKRPAAFHGTLAWLVNTAFDYDWRGVRHFRDYHDGAVERARTCGFKLELFDFNSPDMKPARMASILRARNISGLLLCPQPLPNLELDFPWEHFSAVTFGYSLAKPHLHTVSAAHYRSICTTVEHLTALGYRRIGFTFARSHVERTDNNYLAAFLATVGGPDRLPAVPPLLEPSRSAAVVGPWLKRHRPDAIISGNDMILDLLKKLQIKVPEDLGVACPCLPASDMGLAGIFEDSKRIGAIAVDFLVAMINRGERGVPNLPHRIHVEGPWVQGQSLRPI